MSNKTCNRWYRLKHGESSNLLRKNKPERYHEKLSVGKVNRTADSKARGDHTRCLVFLYLRFAFAIAVHDIALLFNFTVW